LAHVWQRVPHYQASLEQAGVGPNDLKNLEDLAKLPLLAVL